MSWWRSPDTSSFAYQQAQTNSQVLAVQAQLREALNKELGLTADEVNKGYFNIVQAVNPDDLVNISEVAWDKLIEYLQDKGKPLYRQILKPRQDSKRIERNVKPSHWYQVKRLPRQDNNI